MNSITIIQWVVSPGFDIWICLKLSYAYFMLELHVYLLNFKSQNLWSLSNDKYYVTFNCIIEKCKMLLLNSGFYTCHYIYTNSIYFFWWNIIEYKLNELRIQKLLIQTKCITAVHSFINCIERKKFQYFSTEKTIEM